MLYQLKMALAGQAWTTAVRRSIEAYLRGRGESVERDIEINKWQFGSEIWATIGPSREDAARHGGDAELMAGGLGYRRIKVDLRTLDVVDDFAFQ